MDEADVGGFLDLAYGAAVQPELWPEVLVRFADLTASQGAGLVWQDQASRKGRGVVSQIDPAVLPVYFGAFATQHPSQRWMHNPGERLRHFVPKIVADDDALPKDQLVRTGFYNDFMRPFDLHSVMRLGLTTEGHDAAFLMVTRPRSRDRFEGSDLAILNTLHPHLIRAFNLGRKLEGARPLQGAAEAVLDRSADALLVVKADGRVVHANRAAEAHFASRAGLRLSAHRLAAPSPTDSGRLLSLIADATRADAAKRQGGSMAMTAPNRRLPFSVIVAPLAGEASPAAHGRRAALVAVTDLESELNLPQLRMRKMFDFSRTEAKVAEAILEGDTPKEAADRLGISFYTVRGHLVRIFEKTGVRRQAELVRLLARLAAVSEG